MTNWPDDRPESYNPDVVWDETEEEWSADPAIFNRTGARYRQYVVAIVEGDTIYYGEV